MSAVCLSVFHHHHNYRVRIGNAVVLHIGNKLLPLFTVSPEHLGEDLIYYRYRQRLKYQFLQTNGLIQSIT